MLYEENSALNYAIQFPKLDYLSVSENRMDKSMFFLRKSEVMYAKLYHRNVFKNKNTVF